MSHIVHESREALLERLIELVKSKLPVSQAELVIRFIYQYYATVSLDDLLEHDLDNIYGALLSQWNLGLVRKPDEVKLQVYNPHYEQNGWQSPHTIIEIVQDDMPFLVDSIQMELNQRGITTHMIIHLGGVQVIRDEQHRIVNIFTSEHTPKQKHTTEAFLFFEIDHQTDPHFLADLEKRLHKILNDVRMAVHDWRKILHKMEDCIVELTSNPPSIEEKDLEEVVSFLRWIASDHFTFLGYREYELVQGKEDIVLCGVAGTGLGVLQDKGESCGYRSFAHMTPEARVQARSNYPLIIAKTNTKSTIHRPAYTDYIGIKKYNAHGDIIGEHRFIGLYTSAAYNRSPRDIPLLRKKVEEVMSKSGLTRNGHAGKALLNILETFPRDDLFQATSDELLAIGMGILHIQERRRVKLFVRKDLYGRFMSCLLYVPRDRYNTDLRAKVQDVLYETFNGTEVSFTTAFSESVLARIHYIIRIEPGSNPQYDVKELQDRIIRIIRSWEDDLTEYLIEAFGEERANRLIANYMQGFPAGYREVTVPRSAVIDIEHLEKLTKDHPLQMNLYKLIDGPEEQIRFKLYHLNEPVTLSDVLPILENMGVRVIDEVPFCIRKKDGHCAWIHDFTLISQKGEIIDLEAVRTIFQNAFHQIWFAHIENDGFNKLVINASLTAEEICVLRAYAKYFRQIGFTFSQYYIEQVLEKYPQISRKLIDLFTLRFDPKLQEKNSASIIELESSIKHELEQVSSLDEDRILRHFFSCINATIRTNYFQQSKTKSKNEDYLSFKLDCEKIPELPLPKPLYEIFVYSPRFEGVHLRTAKVARGGLRWSDRREDFRTEILGLVKAQKVKNAVIVPSGAKGGFVPKNLALLTDRDAIMAEGIACYKLFIRGLLDLTDNIIDGEVVPPVDVVSYDESDPYLVVAADKGTATFSNYANEISHDYGFWLGDAFASGGSAGYDHKKMAITARGAWEAVKRRFREIGMNIQEETFTVVGIGDMAGDVFGNGMLLSRKIKLVAAFNHAHIFIDPNPDEEISFNERQRLFNLPRSAWSDYTPELISQGGGVFNRSAKSIKLSPEIMERFDIIKEVVTPTELIRAILLAKVDLLWNGGIGTFVKASHEININVGDRTNDALRVNGMDLRCKVVGEGGNLGMTQLARVEFDLNGGLVYTDFIDNSGGVDCSDHEVNIKILLNALVRSGDMTEKQRNSLLYDMTDEVADLVLHNNYSQAQAISIAVAQARINFDSIVRFIAELEETGKINREIEFLPDEKTLAERKAKGLSLTRPEICVLLAYSKIILKEDILNSNVPEDACLSQIVATAFPPKLRALYLEQIKNHSLRREIIATQLSNIVIDQMGIVFVKRLKDETGVSTATVMRAYYLAQEVFSINEIWQEIESMDYKIEANTQIEMMMVLAKLVRRATRWFINSYRDATDLQSCINKYKPSVKLLAENLSKLLTGTTKELYEKLLQEYDEKQVPKKMANRVASAYLMFSVLDIVSVANEYEYDPAQVAKVYFTLGASLDLGWVRGQIILQQVDNHWESLAKSAFRDEIDQYQRDLTISVLAHGKFGQKPEACIEVWANEHKLLIDRWRKIVGELRANTTNQFVMYIVAIRALQDLSQASLQSARLLEKNNGKVSAHKKPKNPGEKV